MDVMEKLQILADSAKYDVACTSSGSNRKGVSGAIGNSVAPGICHTFSADGRCISLLKILAKYWGEIKKCLAIVPEDIS